MRDHSSKWTSLTEKLKNPSWTRAGDILVENQDLEKLRELWMIQEKEPSRRNSKESPWSPRP